MVNNVLSTSCILLELPAVLDFVVSRNIGAIVAVVRRWLIAAATLGRRRRILLMLLLLLLLLRRRVSRRTLMVDLGNLGLGWWHVVFAVDDGAASLDAGALVEAVGVVRNLLIIEAVVEGPVNHVGDYGDAVVLVLDDNVPRVDDTREPAQQRQKHVEQKVERHAALYQNREGRQKDGEHGQQQVRGGTVVACANLFNNRTSH